jgi:hypothetical protein
MYPNDAITTKLANETNVLIPNVYLLPPLTRTIFNITINSNSSNSYNAIYCGSNRLYLQRGNGYFFTINVHYICNETIYVDIDKYSSIYLTYTNYDTSIISTSTVLINSGFTYGDVLTILLLIMIFTTIFFSQLKQWLFGVRIENPMKNKYNKDL